jgi:triphosphatase
LKRVLLAMPAVKSEVRLKVVSTYYDTPTLALHRERLSFRVRKQGSEFVQTLKAENPAQADILARKEWEDQIPSKRPVFNAPKTGKRLPDTVRDEELHPVFTTTVTRTMIEISPESSARIEVAIDEGEIRTSKGDAVAPISEIELELKKGDPRVIFDVAIFAACLVRPVTHALPAGLDFERLSDATERRRRAALDHAKQPIMSER